MNKTIFLNILPYINKEDVLVFILKDKEAIYTSWYYNVKEEDWFEYASQFGNESVYKKENSLLNYCNIDNIQIKIVSKKEWCEMKREENYNNFDKSIDIEGSNAQLIANDFAFNCGYTCNYGNNNIGVLCNIAISDEDYYWVFIDKDYNIHLKSCVGGFERVKEKEKWLQLEDDIIREKLDEYFDEYSLDALWSEFYFF